MNEIKVFLSPSETAKEFGMTLNYVYSLCSRGKVEVIRGVNGGIAINKASVIKYLQNSVRRPRNKAKNKTVTRVKNVPEVIKRGRPQGTSTANKRSPIIDFLSYVLATILGAIVGSLIITSIIK